MLCLIGGEREREIVRDNSLGVALNAVRPINAPAAARIRQFPEKTLDADCGTPANH